MNSSLDAVTAEYGHLLPAVREVMTLSDAERLERIKLERWIPHPKARAILERLDELYSWPIRARMPNMLIVGQTNNGKTTIINRFMKSRNISNLELSEKLVIPVVKIEITPWPNLVQIYSAILEALQVPHAPSAKLEKLQALALSMLRETETRLLIIDEAHNIENALPRGQREILALFKYLGNQLMIPLVAVGTEKAWFAIKSDPQMANRFQPFLLPRCDNDKVLLQLLVSFAQMLPLKKASRLADPVLAKLLLNLTDGSIGDISNLLEVVAKHAIQTGEERITIDVLRSCGFVSSAEQRNEVELFAAGV